MAGAFFESFVVSEIIKSYYNKGMLELPLYFYRDKDMNEIDLLIEDAGMLYPIEMKKHADPKKDDIKAFRLIDKIPGVKRAPAAWYAFMITSYLLVKKTRLFRYHICKNIYLYNFSQNTNIIKNKAATQQLPCDRSSFIPYFSIFPSSNDHHYAIFFDINGFLLSYRKI